MAGRISHATEGTTGVRLSRCFYCLQRSAIGACHTSCSTKRGSVCSSPRGAEPVVASLTLYDSRRLRLPMN